MTTDFKNRVSIKKRLNFYNQITREIFFFLPYIESSIPALYSEEYSRHIVLLNKQKKIDFLKFGNPPNPLINYSKKRLKSLWIRKVNLEILTTSENVWLKIHSSCINFSYLRKMRKINSAIDGNKYFKIFGHLFVFVLQPHVIYLTGLHVMS